MSNMTSTANPHSTKNQTALEANMMHTADLKMGSGKPQGTASYLNRPGVLQTIRDDHRAVSHIPPLPTPSYILEGLLKLTYSFPSPDRSVL